MHSKQPTTPYPIKIQRSINPTQPLITMYGICGKQEWITSDDHAKGNMETKTLLREIIKKNPMMNIYIKKRYPTKRMKRQDIWC